MNIWKRLCGRLLFFFSLPLSNNRTVIASQLAHRSVLWHPFLNSAYYSPYFVQLMAPPVFSVFICSLLYPIYQFTSSYKRLTIRFDQFIAVVHPNSNTPSSPNRRQLLLIMAIANTHIRIADPALMTTSRSSLSLQKGCKGI